MIKLFRKIFKDMAAEYRDYKKHQKAEKQIDGFGYNMPGVKPYKQAESQQTK